MLDNAARDIRYALHGMRRTPGFTVVALTTLPLRTQSNASREVSRL